MAKLAVLNREGKNSGTIELPDEIFAVRPNTRVMHQVVVMYHSAQRQGTASNKQRHEVSGGGIKPWRQKGTGRARHGSNRSPLWKGGGNTFGPLPRDFSFELPKKIKKVALRESLNAKFQANNLTCLDDVKEKLNKTKEFSDILNTLKLDGTILAVLDGCDKSIERVSRNIRSFDIKSASEINAYDVLQHKKLLATKTAVQELLKRIKK